MDSTPNGLKKPLTIAERIENLRAQLAQALATVHGLQGAIAVLEELQRDAVAGDLAEQLSAPS